MSTIQVNALEARKLIDSHQVLLLDVRTSEEFSRSKISGSTLLPLTEFEHQITQIVPDKSQPVLVYCLSGSRSAIAASILENKGYQKIYNLTKGLLEWRISEYPLEE